MDQVTRRRQRRQAAWAIGAAGIVVLLILAWVVVAGRNRKADCENALDRWVETGEQAEVLDEKWCLDLMIDNADEAPSLEAQAECYAAFDEWKFDGGPIAGQPSVLRETWCIDGLIARTELEARGG